MAERTGEFEGSEGAYTATAIVALDFRLELGEAGAHLALHVIDLAKGKRQVVVAGSNRRPRDEKVEQWGGRGGLAKWPVCR